MPESGLYSLFRIFGSGFFCVRSVRRPALWSLCFLVSSTPQSLHKEVE